jgi:hypothetical protein
MAKATLSSEERHQGLHTVSEIDLAKIIQVCHKTIKQANNGRGGEENILNFTLCCLKCPYKRSYRQECVIVILYKETKQATESALRKLSQMSHLIDKVFKSDIINLFKVLKEIMFNEVEKGVIIMCHQIESINNETEIIHKHTHTHIKDLDLENIVTKMRILLEGFNSLLAGKFELEEERISKLEDGLIEVI